MLARGCQSQRLPSAVFPAHYTGTQASRFLTDSTKLSCWHEKVMSAPEASAVTGLLFNTPQWRFNVQQWGILMTSHTAGQIAVVRTHTRLHQCRNFSCIAGISDGMKGTLTFPACCSHFNHSACFHQNTEKGWSIYWATELHQGKPEISISCVAVNVLQIQYYFTKFYS